MTPGFAVNDLGDGVLPDPILCRQLFLRDAAGRIPGPDLPDGRLGQLRLVTAFAFAEASLARGISHIACLGVEEQMVGMDTGRIISTGAIMADFQAGGDRAAMQLPRNPVRLVVQGVTVRSTADLKHAVPAFRASTGPEPTRSGLVDLFPEARCQSLVARSTHAFRAAIERWRLAGPLETAAMDEELAAAVGAGAGNLSKLGWHRNSFFRCQGPAVLLPAPVPLMFVKPRLQSLLAMVLSGLVVVMTIAINYLMRGH